MQNDYPQNPDAARPGLIADLSKCTTESVVSSAIAYHGRLMCQNASGVKAHPAAEADVTTKGKVSGVVVASFNSVNSTDGLEPHHAAKTPFAVIRKGPVAVFLDQDVAVDDPVYVRFANNAGVSMEQTLTPDAAPASGSIVLTDGELDTPEIAFDASAATIQTALETIYGEDNVTVTGTFATAVVVTGAGALEFLEMNPLEVKTNTLKTAVPADVTVTVETTVEPEAVSSGNAGKFRMDADDPEGDDPKAALLSKARYITSGLKGKTAVVELDL